MDYPKVLLSCPITNIKSYCLYDWLAYVSTFNYPNLEYYFVDTSKDIEHAKQISEIGFKVSYQKPEGMPRDFVTKAQNNIRDYFLNSDCEYLFMLECDQYPPKDVVEYLVGLNKQIVGASYYLFSGSLMKSVSTHAIHTANSLELRHLNVLEDFYTTGSGISRVRALGLGCILIHRSVLEKIPFRVKKGESMASDSYFHEDLIRNKIPCYVDKNIVIDHVSDGWGINVELMN